MMRFNPTQVSFTVLLTLFVGTSAMAIGPTGVTLQGVDNAAMDPLFTDPKIQVKKGTENRAPADIDDEILKEFVPLAPGEEYDREPASTKKKAGKARKARKTKSAKKSVKGANAKDSMDAPPGASGRLPSSASDGFELRVRDGEQISRFWVIKRQGRHDLLFVNSTGSQATLTIPPEAFHYLQTAASEIHANKSEISRCPTASMQLFVVQSGKPDKNLDACISSRSKSAASIRTLSGLVASFIR
jgi:hypothetical protein